MKRLNACVCAAVALLAFGSGAQAAVSRVIVVETSDLAAYTKQLDKVRAGLVRIGNKETLRVWKARFAGPNAGQIVVTIEYADMAAYAADDTKMKADAELAGLLKDLDKVRKVTSDSIYDEVK